MQFCFIAIAFLGENCRKPPTPNRRGGKARTLMLEESFLFFKIFSRVSVRLTPLPYLNFRFLLFCFFTCLGNPRSHQRDVLGKAQKRYTFAQDLLFWFYSR